VRREPFGASQASRPQGFTILELLVVLAIVSVLVSLISSALNQAKARARQVGCLNNLRQLQTAWSFYADENDDRLPLNRSTPSANERFFGRRNTSDSWVAGNPKEDISTENIEQGSLFRHLNSPVVYRCPGDTAKVPVKKDTLRTRSYSMSAYLNGDDAGTDPRVKVKMSEVETQPASKIFVFIEEDAASSWLGSFSVGPSAGVALAAGTVGSSLPGSWHQDGADLSFADGHVEYWRWNSFGKSSRSTGPVLLQRELRDLRRLQDAIPRP
jgi:prepilin-type N-terminal cleavage/methylation domain-containing protein/prepilin-type processing-associated H-X9-DG protein